MNITANTTTTNIQLNLRNLEKMLYKKRTFLKDGQKIIIKKPKKNVSESYINKS